MLPTIELPRIDTGDFTFGESWNIGIPHNYQRDLDVAYNGDEAQYRRAAKSAGVPSDTIKRYIKAGYVALPHQLEFAAYARQADGGEIDKVGIGGRRGPGKTHGVFAHTVIDDLQRVPGLKFLFLRKVKKAARESFEDLRVKVLSAVPHDYKVQQGLLTLPNGSRMIIGHFNAESDIDAYLGIEYDGMIVEELNTLSKTKVDLLFGSLRTSKPNWHPRAYPTFNPGGVGHGHVKKTFIIPFRRGKETLTRFVDCGVDDNPFVNKSYRRFLEGLTGWLKRAWLHGDWDILAGQFFTTWNEKHHVYDSKLPAGNDYWLALDYGRVHWNVALLLCQIGDTIYVVDEYASRYMSVQDDAANIHAMLARHGLTIRDMIAMPAGHDIFIKRKRNEYQDKSIAEDYLDYGIEWEHAVTDRVNGAAEILKLLGNPRRNKPARLLIHKRCSGLIERMPLMEHDPKRPEDILKVDCDETGEGGDDHIDCLRYGIMAAGGQNRLVTGRNPMANYRG